jgi:hypothetical protein
LFSILESVMISVCMVYFSYSLVVDIYLVKLVTRVFIHSTVGI